jgi:hypothetical protein
VKNRKKRRFIMSAISPSSPQKVVARDQRTASVYPRTASHSSGLISWNIIPAHRFFVLVYKLKVMENVPCVLPHLNNIISACFGINSPLFTLEMCY